MVLGPAGHRLAALVGACLLALGASGCSGRTTNEDRSVAKQPEGSGAQDVAVELPGLPIAGTSVVLSDTLQCVDVGWTDPPDLPDWLAVTVTGVELRPKDGFALSSDPCPGGNPPCLDSSVRLTTTRRCSVAVTWTGPTLHSDRLLFFTSGLIRCAPATVDECQAFRAEVEAAGPRSVELSPAPSEKASDSTQAEGGRVQLGFAGRAP
jgi:hypothetical protein